MGRLIPIETVGYKRMALCGGADGFGSCLTDLFYWQLLCLGLGLTEASSGEPLRLDVSQGGKHN